MSHISDLKRPTRCERCSKKYRGRGPWNSRVVRGVIVGILCPSCQTADENAEAEVHEATLEYARDPFGRLVGRAKAGA